MWQAKVLKDTVKAALPFQDGLRRLKRRLSPYTANSSNIRLALSQGLEQIELLKDAGADLGGDVLEIGSGWVPVIPMLFQLAGARRVVLTDIERLMDGHTIAIAKAAIVEESLRVAAALGIDAAELAERLRQPFTPEYRVPWSPAAHAADDVDIVVSRTVFEHIAPDVLADLMTELGRILRPGGVMCHIVDNSDHWEHGDKTISRINFLRYEDGPWWRLACFNPQNYQNRMRHSDYERLFRRLGWEPVVSAGEPDPRCLEDLKALPLATPFRGYDPADLAILTSVFVLRRAQDPDA